MTLPTCRRPHTPQRWWPLAVSAILSLWLQACATTAPTARLEPGLHQTAIASQRGLPTASYRVGENTHWFYDIGSVRVQRDLLIFDAQGTLLQTSPAWSRQAFAQIQPGQTDNMQLLQHFGPPLRQGKYVSGLLESLEPGVEKTAAHYWQYAFLEHGQYFNVMVLLDEKNRVTQVEITQDQPLDQYS